MGRTRLFHGIETQISFNSQFIYVSESPSYFAEYPRISFNLTHQHIIALFQCHCTNIDQEITDPFIFRHNQYLSRNIR
jgi:hypothetical protein